MPWWVLPGLALIAEIIFSAGLALAFIRGNETQQTTMLTAAIGLSATAFGFFYQSSLGSKQAAATIAEKLNGASQDKPVAIAVSGVNEDRK